MGHIKYLSLISATSLFGYFLRLPLLNIFWTILFFSEYTIAVAGSDMSPCPAAGEAGPVSGSDRVGAQGPSAGGAAHRGRRGARIGGSQVSGWDGSPAPGSQGSGWDGNWAPWLTGQFIYSRPRGYADGVNGD